MNSRILSHLKKWASVYSGGSILLLVLTVHRSILLGQSVITWDLYDYILPQILYIKDSIKIGVFPLWNPFIMSGEAFFSQPATFVYNPFHLILAVLPELVSTFYALELLVVSLCFVGGLGVYVFLKRQKIDEIISAIGGGIFCLTAFGPLLGQLPVVVSISFFPWLLVLVGDWVEEGEKQKKRLLFCKVTLLVSLLFLSSYFGTILYVLIFSFAFALLLLWRRRNGSAKGPKLISYCQLGFIAIGAIFVAAVYFIPAFANRFYLYSDLLGDFVSPDPRLRSMLVNRDQIVDIIRNEKILISILFGANNLAPNRAFWVIGVGSLSIIFAGYTLLFYGKKFGVKFFGIVSIVTILYVLGPGGLVFELVYRYVPILKNIRYPVFAFFILQFCIICLASIGMQHITNDLLKNRILTKKFVIYLSFTFLATFALGFMSDVGFFRISITAISILTIFTIFFRLKLKNKIYFWAPFVMLAIVDVVNFVEGSGVFQGRAQNIIENAEIRSDVKLLDIRAKFFSEYKNSRVLKSGTIFDFANKDWILQKELSNHGYSTSDNPLYWYVKDKKFLEKIFWTPEKILKVSLPRRGEFNSDNEYLEELKRLIPNSVDSGVYLEEKDNIAMKSLEQFSQCEVGNIIVKPNSISTKVVGSDKCLLFLTNKYFPGWKAEINDKEAPIFKVNRLFMGVILSPGENYVKFTFSPRSFWWGLWISILSFLCFLIYGLLNRYLLKKV